MGSPSFGLTPRLHSSCRQAESLTRADGGRYVDLGIELRLFTERDAEDFAATEPQLFSLGAGLEAGEIESSAGLLVEFVRPLEQGEGVLDLGPHLVLGEAQLPVDLHELRIGRLQSAPGIATLGRQLKDQRRLQHLPVEAVGTGKGAFAEAGILVSGELAIEIGECLVGGEPPFDEKLFPLQGKPPELGP